MKHSFTIVTECEYSGHLITNYYLFQTAQQVTAKTLIRNNSEKFLTNNITS